MKIIQIACRSALIAAAFAVASISSVAHAEPGDAEDITVINEETGETRFYDRAGTTVEFQLDDDGVTGIWELLRSNTKVVVLQRTEDGAKFKFNMEPGGSGNVKRWTPNGAWKKTDWVVRQYSLGTVNVLVNGFTAY